MIWAAWNARRSTRPRRGVPNALGFKCKRSLDRADAHDVQEFLVADEIIPYSIDEQGLHLDKD